LQYYDNSLETCTFDERYIFTFMLEPLLREHWEAVKAIYEDGIATGNATFQTSAPADWQQWDKGHLPHSRFVVKAEGKVIGWVALSPTSARECYRGVCELSIYMDNNNRGKGIGTLLLKAVIESSEAAGVWCLQKEIYLDYQ
jgi:L-amino acid N-acyltransferase YncA